MTLMDTIGRVIARLAMPAGSNHNLSLALKALWEERSPQEEESKTQQTKSSSPVDAPDLAT